jgi:hypothetical protein
MVLVMVVVAKHVACKPKHVKRFNWMTLTAGLTLTQQTTMVLVMMMTTTLCVHDMGGSNHST